MMKLIFVLSVVVSLSACSRSEPDSRSAKVDKLFEQWNKTGAPGCAVGVSHNGAIVYEHAYGMANLERGVPITPETVFPIASISKAFTSMSVLLAAEQGKLSLDDEVQKFIPEWVDREDHIAIRHLLSHTSGLRDAFTLLGWARPSESAGQNEAIVRILARQRGLNFKPGTQFEYNNGGYNLLATILTRATGQSLREFAAANIFKPLGMTQSHFQDDPTMVVPNRASGYTRTIDGWVPAKGDTGIVGNGGMQSTVGDLLRWAQNYGRHGARQPGCVHAGHRCRARITWKTSITNSRRLARTGSWLMATSRSRSCPPQQESRSSGALSIPRGIRD